MRVQKSIRYGSLLQLDNKFAGDKTYETEESVNEGHNQSGHVAFPGINKNFVILYKHNHIFFFFKFLMIAQGRTHVSLEVIYTFSTIECNTRYT